MAEKSQNRREQANEINKQREKELFEKAKEALKLLDPNKAETRTSQTFNKTVLRTYLQNVYNYQSQIRQLSRYLYRVVGTYKRIIDYYVRMIDLSVYSVVPIIDFSEDVDKDAVLKQYVRTLQKLENMNLKQEFYKLILEAWVVGVAYGLVWESDEPDSFLITLFDPDYCKISSVNFDGTFNYSIDMSWFRAHQTQLEFYGSTFQKMYDVYTKDPNNMRWQEVPSEMSVVLCMDPRDTGCILPPFVPLFEDLCDLSDLRSIQAAKDELSIYKLLVARLETISGSDISDDFTVDPSTALGYINKIQDQLDSRIGLLFSPVKIESIDFDTDDTAETNKIANSMKNVLNTSGGSQILLADSISGSTAYRNAMIADMEFGLHPLLDQIESYVNHHLRDTVDDPAKVTFLHTCPYFKDEYRDNLLKSAQYGIPNKIAIATLDGKSPLEVLSANYLETEILGLHDKFIPLSSSFTKTSSDSGDTDPLTGGRPTSDEPLTDEGDNTRDKK